MKVKELIQRVQSLYSKGVHSDDTRLSKRHIYNKLLTVRSRLVSQEARKKRKISEWNYQTIACLELEVVPSHLCPCVPPVGCDILRSKVKLPKPLMGLTDNMITYVSTIDRSIEISPTTINRVNRLRGNKYTSRSFSYFILRGFLYVVAPTNLKMVSIVGLFEDPLEVKKLEDFCLECDSCQDCADPLEEEFPIDSELIEPLIEISVQELIGVFNELGREKETNNTSGSPNK